MNLAHPLFAFPPGVRRLLGAVAAIALATASLAASLTVTPPQLPAPVGGVAYSQTLAATGGTAPYAWKVQSGGLPTGLALSPAGVISGTPSTATWVYGYPFAAYIAVTDSAGAKAYLSLTLTVSAPSNTASGSSTTSAATATPLAIATTTLPDATGGVAYSQTLAATGGTAPYTWKLQSGGLPPGVSLAANGVVSGTPGTATWIYSYPFSSYLTVTDSAGASASVSLTIKVLAPAGSGSGSTGGGSSGSGTPSTYTVTLTNGTLVGTTATSFTAGTTVTIAANAAPSGQYFKQWTGNVALANSFAASTSFTMPASNVTLSASYYAPAPVPQPIADHPRLWLNSGDLAALRTRATASNPIYQNLLPLLSTCLANYNTQFYPGGQPNPTNPDFGDTQGYTGLITEQHALVFALFSLIDPDPTQRPLHAQRARNIIMMAMNEAVKGHAAGQPFRDPMFATFNRANFTSECWPLAIDWLQGVTDANGQPVAVFSAADKKTIRDVFMIWASDCLNAYTCGGDHPSPIGVMNSTALLPSGNAHRVAANNYYAGHARLLTLMALALDPADDPAIDPTAPAAVLGNSLRSYIPNATGAWLYQQFAMFGDPADVRAAFGLSANASVGLASGGLSPEGGLYGHSYSYLLGEMLALKTAGFADTTLSGPQAALVTAPVWDRYLAGFANSIVPTAKVYPSQSYLGPVFQMASYGDVLRLWITPDFMQVFALKNLLDQKNGVTTNDAATRWFAVNAVEGGPAALASHISQPWSYGVQDAVLYFLLLDPAKTAPADPRPAYAPAFLDAGNGRLLARTDWSASASIFTFRASWQSINHQNNDAGQFELYRNGEWLTKELGNYDNNGNGQSSLWHNSLALHNWCANGTPKLNFYEAAYWPNGSQWNNGANAGDPVTALSSGAGYAYAQTDLTKLYNRPDIWTAANAAVDIQHASRSILWLDRDFIVVYDRATSLHSGLFKRFNLNVTALPVIDGTNRRATVVTPGGQYLSLQTLLPANAALTYTALDSSVSNIAGLETTVGRLVVEDPTNPTDIRFLHVIQGADSAANVVGATALASTSGTAFSGALVGRNAVLFPQNLGGSFLGTAYSTPLAATKHYVGGLTPGATYSVIAVANGTTADIVIQPSATGTFTADNAGLLAFDLSAALQ